MSNLVVDRATARYHLRPAQMGQRKRLDSILGTLFEDSPDLLTGANVPTDEEVCIRSLTVLIPVRLDSSDSALTKRWSGAIADAVDARLTQAPGRDGSQAFVRYRSRGHALLDVVRSVSRGSRERAWAWEQMGLVRRSATAGASELIVEALSSEPERLVPVLAEVARTDGLANVSAVLGGSDWWTIAMAALGATRIASLPLELLSIRSSSRGREDAASLSAQSSIWAARPNRWTETFLVERGPVALSILALLESAPALLIFDPARGFDVIVALAEVLAREWAGNHQALDDRTAGIAGAGRPELGERESTAAAPGASRRLDPHPQASEAASSRESNAQDHSDIDVEEAVEHAGELDPAAAISAAAAYTEWGGLLFLLHLVERLDVPAAVISDEALRERPLRWVLHRLALSLIPIAADDPAALAFAGLAPGSSPPESEPPDLAAHEVAALGKIRARLVEEVRELLERRLDEESALLEELMRREAHIDGSPGWLVVHLPLTTISTDIRRSGLDLDPGYLPWLGVVLKFAYE